MNRLEVLFTMLMVCFASITFAQDPGNMNLLGSYDDNTLPTHSGVQYNDVWGYANEDGEFAIVGNAEYILFLDVTDPTNIPAPLLQFDAGFGEVWRDFKTFGNYVYGVCDSCSEGLHVFETDGDAVTHVGSYTGDFGSAHNIYVDVPNERLYAVGVSGSTDMIVFDLSVTPENPDKIVDVNFGSGFYVHDVYVKDNIAYCSHGWDDFYIWDMTDPFSPVELGTWSTPNYNHSSWVSDDGGYLYFAEEVSTGLPMTVLDLSNMGHPTDALDTIKTFQHGLEDPADGLPTAHNPYVVGDLLVISYYEDGVKVYNIADPTDPVLVGQYDTYSPNNGNGYNGYNGCWGVYPFLPSGNILATDITYGLHVLEYVTACDDGVKNGDETGVDCGGLDCDPCDDFCLTIEENNFDSGFKGWVDGGSDCRKSSQDAAFAYSGTKCIRLRDNSTTSKITSPVLDLSFIDQVSVSFTYITSGMESGEDFFFQVSTNGGSTFTTVLTYESGSDFMNGAREFVVDESIFMTMSNQTVFRFICDASDNSDYVYIDDVVIQKCPTECTEAQFTSFETGLEGWSDDGADCRRSANDSAFANSGTYCVRIQDDSSTSSVTSKSYDFDGAESAVVSFSFITSSMEAGEEFYLQYSLNGGATFDTHATFTSGVYFTNGVREFVNAEIEESMSANTVFRFKCNGSNNNDRVYIDDIEVDVCAQLPSAITQETPENTILSNRNLDNNDIVIYPNPVSSFNSLSIEFQDVTVIDKFEIYNIAGQKMIEQKTNSDQRVYNVNMSSFNNGTYILHVYSGDEIKSERIMVVD